MPSGTKRSDGKKPFFIWLSPELKQKLRLLAAYDGRTMTALVAFLLEREWERKREREWKRRFK